MRNINDLIGQKYGRLTVTKLYSDKIGKNNHAKWICECSCGNKVTVKQDNLISGNTRSCGCLVSETSKKVGIESGSIYAASEAYRYKGTKINHLSEKKPKNNTSGHKGVYWDNKRSKWFSKITLQKKTKFLGYHDKKEEAIKARKIAEKLLFSPIIEEFNNKK